MAAFWRLVKFLLEGTVFLLVGLQLRDVLSGLDPPWTTTALVTGTVLGTVLVGRFIWVYPATYLARLVPKVRRRDPNPPPAVPTVVAWAGMRGVVTLAAALALPLTLADGEAYPRALFVWVALAVIIVTLLLQGATLPYVSRRLRLPAEDPAREALAAAAVQHEASRAARNRLAEVADDVPPDVAERLRQRAEDRANVAWERVGGDRETPSEAYARLRQDMIDVERQVFRRARDDGRIPEEVLVRAYRDLDLEESLLRAQRPE
jgi:CPA1 family monovalent cation:H+ antiporter